MNMAIVKSIQPTEHSTTATEKQSSKTVNGAFQFLLSGQLLQTTQDPKQNTDHLIDQMVQLLQSMDPNMLAALMAQLGLPAHGAVNANTAIQLLGDGKGSVDVVLKSIQVHVPSNASEKLSLPFLDGIAKQLLSMGINAEKLRETVQRGSITEQPIQQASTPSSNDELQGGVDQKQPLIPTSTQAHPTDQGIVTNRNRLQTLPGQAILVQQIMNDQDQKQEPISQIRKAEQPSVVTPVLTAILSEEKAAGSDSTKTKQDGLKKQDQPGSVITQFLSPVQAIQQTVTANGNKNVEMTLQDFKQSFPDLVVKNASLLDQGGRNVFHITLMPQGLGEVQVRIQGEGQHLVVQILTDSSVARSLIDSSLNTLKMQFDQQGIPVQRVEVASVPSQSSMLLSDWTLGQDSQQQRGSQSQQQSKRHYRADDLGDVDEIPTWFTQWDDDLKKIDFTA